MSTQVITYGNQSARISLTAAQVDIMEAADVWPRNKDGAIANVYHGLHDGEPSMGEDVEMSAQDFVDAMGDTLEDWAIGEDWEIHIAPDGSVSGLTPEGRAYHDLDGWDGEIRARALAVALVRQ